MAQGTAERWRWRPSVRLVLIREAGIWTTNRRPFNTKLLCPASALVQQREVYTGSGSRRKRVCSMYIHTMLEMAG